MAAAVVSFFLLVVGAGHSQEVPVLVYHDVVSTAVPEPGRFDQVPMESFKQQMKYLHDNGYKTITIDELVSFVQGGSVPEKAILLNFDDGWKSIPAIIPLLKQYHFKASFFIFPGGIGQADYMTWDDIRAIARDPDFQIEAHSMTHPWAPTSNLLTWVEGKTAGKGPPDADYELRESKRVLENILNRKIDYFAWPSGYYNGKLVGMAEQAGYQGLLTIHDGPNTRGDSPFAIKRTMIDGFCDMTVFRQVLRDCRFHVCYRAAAASN
jgi:peptidoglycan/xylan/chitin deacetylase (PgdA/CDA1 family)